MWTWAETQRLTLLLLHSPTREERVERSGGGGAACAASVCNPELEALEAELREGADEADGFLLYLLGLVLSARYGGSVAPGERPVG